MLGEFESYDDATNDALVRQSTPEWPHAFARLDVPGPVFLSNFGANHIHAIPGDRRAELRAAARLLGVRLEEWSR
jgi:L-fucose isomerase